MTRAAVWRRSSLGPRTGGFRRVPPVLAAEVAGQDEDEAALLAKADWYLGHGVEVVWLLFPRPRSVLVVTPFGRTRLSSTKRLARHASLSGLTQKVSEFFRQLGR
ncbi:MAG: Uma2 family endonuclease [Myxococcales bacterium]|nr:Uma2 family endonuclease [Myxococcales bacterium]